MIVRVNFTEVELCVFFGVLFVGKIGKPRAKCAFGVVDLHYETFPRLKHLQPAEGKRFYRCEIGARQPDLQGRMFLRRVEPVVIIELCSLKGAGDPLFAARTVYLRR